MPEQTAPPLATAPTPATGATHSATTNAKTGTASALPLLDGALPLPHWGLIRAQGADAAKFLHGQLTQDFALLGLTEARLAAFCSPKGRMLASFVGFKLAADDILLACHRDLLPATLKRLSMFVMRAQCKLSDASGQFDLYGVAGGSAQQLALSADLGPATWAKASLPGEAGTCVRLPAAGGAARVDAPADTAAASATTSSSAASASPSATADVVRLLACVPVGTPLPLATPVLPGAEWDWLEVQSGVAMVGQALTEAFVPQMLNYESVGGVNFKKGCYPGQEVVARSQFRGTLKRRTYRVACATPLATPLSVGQEVFHSSDAEQSCGTVVATAELNGQVHALVSMPTSATEGGQLTAMSPQGAVLTLLSLPYELLADV